ncbi:hypothetical protein [Methylomonas sp. CM2]
MFFLEKLYGLTKLFGLLVLLGACKTANASFFWAPIYDLTKPITSIVWVDSTPFTWCLIGGECQSLGSYRAFYGSNGYGATSSSIFYQSAPAGTQKTPLDVEASLAPNPAGVFDWGQFNVPQFLPYDLGSNLSGTFKIKLTLNRELADLEEVYIAIFQNRDPDNILLGDWELLNQKLLADDTIFEGIFNSEAGLSTRLFVHGFAFNALEYHITVSEVPIPSSALLLLTSLLFFCRNWYFRKSVRRKPTGGSPLGIRPCMI